MTNKCISFKGETSFKSIPDPRCTEITDLPKFIKYLKEPNNPQLLLINAHGTIVKTEYDREGHGKDSVEDYTLYHEKILFNGKPMAAHAPSLLNLIPKSSAPINVVFGSCFSSTFHHELHDALPNKSLLVTIGMDH